MNTGRVAINADINIIGYSQKKHASQTRTNPNKQRLSRLYDKAL